MKPKIGSYFPFKFLCLGKPRSKTWTCFYISLISLFIQIIIFICLMNSEENPTILSVTKTIPDNLDYFYEDLKALLSYGSDVGLYFIIFEPCYFKNGRDIMNNLNQKKNVNRVTLKHCPKVDLVLGIDHGIRIDRLNELLQTLIDQEFVPITFYNSQPIQLLPKLMNIQTSIFLQRRTTFQIILLYPREDSTWWFGDIRSDPLYKAKLASLNLSLDQINIMAYEGAIERFEVTPSTLDEESHLLFPQDVRTFSFNLNNSKFIECNVTRSALYQSQFGMDKSVEAIRFRHKVWKMLSRVKIVLDSLRIPFWLSSGTALGQRAVISWHKPSVENFIADVICNIV